GGAVRVAPRAGLPFGGEPAAELLDRQAELLGRFVERVILCHGGLPLPARRPPDPPRRSRQSMASPTGRTSPCATIDSKPPPLEYKLPARHNLLGQPRRHDGRSSCAQRWSRPPGRGARTATVLPFYQGPDGKYNGTGRSEAA